MRGSGTSMSAAIVSGAVAAVLDAHPGLEPNGVKSLLTRTAYNLKGRDAGEGAGGLDLGKALDRADRAASNPRMPSDSDVDKSDLGPKSDDAAVWADFAQAWEDGDLPAAQAAWRQLSSESRVWASRAFAIAVVYGSADSAHFEARGWAARGWAARGWASEEWLARGWAARGWASEEWLARGWAARGWAARGWAARGWAARGWAAEDWEARGWAARGWAAEDSGSPRLGRPWLG